MKNFTRIFAAVFLIGLSQKISAQASVNAFGLIPKDDEYIKCGEGFGFNYMSRNLIPLDSAKIKKGKKSFEVRAGIGFYSSLLRSRVFEGSRMDSIYLPSHTLKTNVYGLNLTARISGAYSSNVVPYLDLFVGIRNFTGSDENSHGGYAPANECRQYNIGATAGLLLKMSNSFYFDMGVMCTHSNAGGQMLDANSGNYSGDRFMVDYRPVPTDIFMIKAGLVYRFGFGKGKGKSSGGGSGSGGGGGSQSSSYNNQYYYYENSNSGSGNSSDMPDRSSSSGSSNNGSNNSSSNSSSSGSNSSSGGSNSSHSSNNNSYSPASNSSSGSSSSSSGSNSNHSTNTNSYVPATVGPEPKHAPGSNSSTPAPAQNSKVNTGGGKGGR